MTLTCQFCSSAFELRTANQGPKRAAAQRFCSHRCSNISRNPRRPRGYFGPLLCQVDGCGKDDTDCGLCAAHGFRLRQHGDADVTRPVRSRRPSGTGSFRDGYVTLFKPEHPNASKNGLLFEHRYVMANTLGRALYQDERVHHKNGVRTDNRPENLELWVTAHPSGQRPEDVVAHALEMLRRYAPLELAA